MPGTAQTAFLATFVVACQADLFLQWHSITCERPIKPWLVGLYSLLALLKLMVELLTANESPPFKKVGLGTALALIPLSFVWIGLGAFWITGVDLEEPECILEHGSLITLLCVGIALFLVVVYTFMGFALVLYALTPDAFDPAQTPDWLRQPLLLGGSAEAASGLQKNEMKRLDSRVLPRSLRSDSGEREQCSICREELSRGDSVLEMPRCRHTYHG